MIQKAVKDEFKVHSMRFDYKFKNTSPYNTTDVGGWWHTMNLLTQFINKMQVQYFFNLQNEWKSKSDDLDELQKFIRSSLMSPGREYELQLDYNNHREFLKYWEQNN